MAYVLLVEPDKTLADTLANSLSQRKGISVRVVDNYPDAQKLIEEHPGTFSCAVFDLDLDDIDHDFLVEIIATSNIPAIALTENFDTRLKDSILSLQVIDYFVKNNLNEIEQITALVAQLHRNRDIRVLVVDQSSSFQKYLTELLRKYQFQVFTATTPQEALRWIDSRQSKPMDLIIVENAIQQGLGHKLVSQLRIRLHRESVAIIGVTQREFPLETVSMFKAGANDVIGKPFLQEEFACRVGHTLDMVKNFQAIKSHATRDFLTRLYNRRHLIETGEMLHAAAMRGAISLQCIFLDIENFDQITQKYGHHLGDVILQQLAELLRTQFKQCDFIARYGGEEFCILTLGYSQEQLQALKCELVQCMSEQLFGHEFESIPITIGVGLSTRPCKSFAEMLHHTYQHLLKIKQSRQPALINTT